MAVIVLPTQLFENNELIKNNTKVYMIEHNVYFTMYKYHKLKLIMHRASMKYYEDYIKKKYDCIVKYYEYHDRIDDIFRKNKKIELYDPVDMYVMDDLKLLAKKYDTQMVIYDTPLFLTTNKDMSEYISNGGKFIQKSFYIWQRMRLDIFMIDNKPLKGKWTFDKENRLPYDDKIKDQIFTINRNKYVLEAKKYVNKYFDDNPGEDDYYLPIDHAGAKHHLHRFLKYKLGCFGHYQDAVGKNLIFGCHSVLSPLLNIGLLTPEYVIECVKKYYNKHKTNYNSVEGFVRQIIGWREYMRMSYVYKHKELIKGNLFTHKKKLNNEWYIGETQMEPIDDIIKKVLKYGYAHHIERLMYLGNFMLLSEIKPTDGMRWFMEMFIDSYHVFMETNVYGMSLHSSGTILATRPYFSSSNYIINMSSYGKKYAKNITLGNNVYKWYEVFDALYYNFINNNKSYLSKNYSIAPLVVHWNNKSAIDKKKILYIAKEYMHNY